MKLLRLDEARPGMRVARDVTDVRGSLLFKQGTVLSGELIQRLRGWKITHIFIVDDTPSQIIDPENNPLQRAAAIDRELDLVFHDAVSNPIMARLREAAGRYLKGHMR
jgi:hypothetical protein